MKKALNVLTWNVKNYFWNHDKISDYDVLQYREALVKKLKKKCTNKSEFDKAMRSEMTWQYWSRAEYELIIEVDENNRIYLKPWVGCVDSESVKTDVTDDSNFDWSGFAEKYIRQKGRDNSAKIDIWDQLEYRWDEFVTYVWTTRLKYERYDPKFYMENV